MIEIKGFLIFGMLMPGRKYLDSEVYRYGFNGKENDNEVKGEGNQQDYGMRVYDPRLGKFLSVDPLTHFYPWYTPYQFAGNKPIANVDLDGSEEKPVNPGTEEGQSQVTSLTIYGSSSSTDADNPQTYSAEWYWHVGGAKVGQKWNAEKKIIEPILSEASLYNAEGYLNILTKTDAAKQLASSYSKWVSPPLKGPEENL